MRQAWRRIQSKVRNGRRKKKNGEVREREQGEDEKGIAQKE